MNTFFPVLCFFSVSVAQGEVLFHTDFSRELERQNYVEPKNGTFAKAKSIPGTFFKSGKGVAFVSDDQDGDWTPPPDTETAVWVDSITISSSTGTKSLGMVL